MEFGRCGLRAPSPKHPSHVLLPHGFRAVTKTLASSLQQQQQQQQQQHSIIIIIIIIIISSAVPPELNSPNDCDSEENRGLRLSVHDDPYVRYCCKGCKSRKEYKGLKGLAVLRTSTSKTPPEEHLPTLVYVAKGTLIFPMSKKEPTSMVDLIKTLLVSVSFM